MKRLITFGIVFAILALGSFEVAQATHTVTSVAPLSFEQQAADRIETVTINLGGAVGTPANNPQVHFTKGAITLNVTLDAFSPIAPISSSWNVTIPAAGVAVGNYTAEVCLEFPGVPFHCANLPNGLRVTLPGGGGVPGGGGGGGFVEDVPVRFGPIPEGPQTGNEFISVVEGLTNWLFVILLVFAVIFIVLAGFQFISGGGDPQAVAQARNKLIWAAVGIAVALLAKGIPAAISNLLIS